MFACKPQKVGINKNQNKIDEQLIVNQLQR
jgi:hypothetical protein